MFVFLINSFNTPFYINKANLLIENIKYHIRNTGIQAEYIVVCGGCLYNYHKNQNDNHYIGIVENLSDHNIYVGFQRNIHLFNNEKFINATYIYLHDTCQVSEHFSSCMKNIDTINLPKSPTWIFAHTFGFFNIGICTHSFIILRAKDFEEIDIIPKNLSILIEQGHYITINNKVIKPLLSYSVYTLANMVSYNGISTIDMYGINGCHEDGNTRWISYISSLGVYKFMGSIASFLVPIWASPLHHPKTEQKFWELKNYNLKKYKTSFTPLLPYNITKKI
jgi:hypothetical protein